MEEMFKQLDAELRPRFFPQPDKTTIQVLETILQEIEPAPETRQTIIKQIMEHIAQIIEFVETREHLITQLGK